MTSNIMDRVFSLFGIETDGINYGTKALKG